MQGRVPQTLWFYEEVGHTQEAKKELLELVKFQNTDNVLDTVKPTRLIQRMLQIATNPNSDDLVVDFFGGSGSTGHAVMAQNRDDCGSRRFVVVQLPEPLPIPEQSLRTIADITKERVRHVIKKLNDEDAGKLDLDGATKQDRGFRVFKLAESNFKPWNVDVPHNADELERQLELHVDHIHDGRTADDLLYEILLKSGFPLTTTVETLTLSGKTVHSVAAGALFICLERALTLEVIRAMAEQQPERVVCLDEGFADNDQIKANAVQLFKTKGVTSFKTV
jgi:adenine-specific DNA-methyltransferase